MLEQKFIRTCFKARFTNKKWAKKALKEINQQMKDVEYWKELKDIYWCEECASWHHTSMGKEDSRKFNRIKENLKK